MPARCIRHSLWLKYPEDTNTSPGNILLSRIIRNVYQPLQNRNIMKKKFVLLCKSVFFSFDVTRRVVAAETLREFYNKNGCPLSLDDDVLAVDWKKFDGIENITIFYEGPDNLRNMILFSRSNGSRTIKVLDL